MSGHVFPSWHIVFVSTVVVSKCNNDLDERHSYIIMDTGVSGAISLIASISEPQSRIRIWGHCFSSIHRFLVFHSLPCQNPLHSLLFLASGQTFTPLSHPLYLRNILCFTMIFLLGCPQNPTLMLQTLKTCPFCFDNS